MYIFCYIILRTAKTAVILGFPVITREKLYNCWGYSLVLAWTAFEPDQKSDHCVYAADVTGIQITKPGTNIERLDKDNHRYICTVHEGMHYHMYDQKFPNRVTKKNE